MKKRLITLITIALILITGTAAFALGNAKAASASAQDGDSYFDSLNNFDWSKTCPAAGCRNNNEGE